MPRPTNSAPTAGNAQFSGGQYITELALKDTHTAQFFQKFINYVNGLATAVAATGSGEVTPPPPIASMSVKVAGEMVHVQHDHPGAIQRGVQYFTEVGVNDAGFNQPIVVDHGASRTSHPFPLPANDDQGTPINYYFRSYAQYHGSKRSEYAYHGSAHAPTAVTLSGSTNLTPLASTGSGTGSNNGLQGGVGLGNTLFRPATTTKRSTGQ